MEIGTAAPSEAERDGVPHHLVGIAEPYEDCSCAEYAARAQTLLTEIAARGAIPIFCGGTGLYLESLLRLNGFAAPQASVIPANTSGCSMANTKTPKAPEDTPVR